MSEEQIKKLAQYIKYLRSRLDVYHAEGDEDMCDYVGAKIEAAREITIVFDCRDEVFKCVEEMEKGV